MEPQRSSSQNFWVIFLISIFTILIAAGGFYFFKQKKGEILCTGNPVSTDIGRVVYPIDPKYENIEFLGQLFTAFHCGPSRVSKISGVEGGSYTLGSAIWLKNKPNQSLIKTFKSIGFECAEEATDTNCQKWELWSTVKTEDLMELEPYHKNFKMDDCRNCG